MFLFSAKNFRFWFSSVIIVLSVIFTAVLLLVRTVNPTRRVSSPQDDLAADCRAFLASHGWSVAPEPPEITDILIPESFNDVFSSYNLLQISQGYDLTPLQGQTVQKYTFRISEYPGLPKDEHVIANVLMKNGEIVGGDICCVRMDGFMHGFSEFEKNELDQAG